MMFRMAAMPSIQFRSIHPRGYNNFNDVYNWDFHEINMQLANAASTHNIVFVFKKFDGMMTPEQIMFGFRRIALFGLERDEDFWKVIVPKVKLQMTTLDRETIKPLLMGIESAALMTLQDNEFWETVE